MAKNQGHPKLDEAARKIAEAELRPCSILVIEDDPDLQSRLARTLTGQGHRVVGTSSGDGALALMSEWTVDLVLVDQSLPGTTGIEVAKRIQHEHAGVRVVIMAAEDDASVRVAARLAGALECVTKPFRFESIAPLLRGLSEGLTPAE